MNYTYKVGGINISSTIYFPELMKSQSSPEVIVSFDEVPDHLDNNKVDFPFIEANNEQYLLKLKNIGRYLVEKGSKITVQAEKNANKTDVEKYILTNIFGALSYQRDLLPFHGGVFVYKGEGILISGLSGNGKSTLLAGLYQKGFKILSDDISNVIIENGKVMVQPCFPRIQIWRDTAEKLKLDVSKLTQIRSDMEKYLIPIEDSYYPEPIELKKIYVLTNSKNNEIKLELKGLGKVESLRKNTFKPWMINTFGKQKEVFQKLISIAGVVSLETFPNNKELEIKDFIANFIKNLSQNA